MEKVLWDVLKVDAYTKNYFLKDTTKNIVLENAKMQFQVFALHNITKDQFYKSYQYYLANSNLIKPLLDSIANNANKEKYKQEASRDIEFVTFSIEPTAEDSAATKTWAYENYEKLKNSKYDSVYVNIMNSENPWDGTYKPMGSYDKEIESQLFALDSGGMLGPIYTNGKYSIYKISGTKKDTQLVFKASHILISMSGGTKTDSMAAQAKVNATMSDLMSGKTKFEDAAISNAVIDV